MVPRELDNWVPAVLLQCTKILMGANFRENYNYIPTALDLPLTELLGPLVPPPVVAKMVTTTL